MRSPVIAFGLFAAAVSPALVSAAPAPKQSGGGFNAKGVQDVSSAAVHMVARQIPALPSIPGTPDIPALHATTAADDKHHDDKDSKKSKNKRAYDFGTAGGNAYTGASGDASGGSVVNHANGDFGETIGSGTLTNAAGTSKKFCLQKLIQSHQFYRRGW